MCGIIGYAGEKNAVEIVYRGLINLEYRGYDSAGAAFGINGRTAVFKRQGRVEKLKPLLEGLTSGIGIGHTRWATHGSPSDINAHPHMSGKITLVHNGIIENYSELKAELEKGGAVFKSQTDSEVIAALMSVYYCGDILGALYKTVKRLKGSYAIMAVAEGENVIAAARHKSPVVIGYGNGGYYCASDEPVLSGECGEVSFLKDGDFALIKPDGVRIFDGELREAERKKQKNLAQAGSLELGGFAHYMLKELRQSPAAVKNTVTAFAEAEDKIRGALSGVNRIIFIGCGTAYHAGLIGKIYVEDIARMPAEAETAGEFRYKNPIVSKNTAVVAVSQSGETADTLEGARLAKSLGARVIAVTNAPYSQLTRIADTVVPVCAGAEICVAATKSYTGQIAALYMLALLLAGKNAGGGGRSGLPEICKSVADGADVYALSRLCAFSKGVYFLGRGLDYAVALEASLKLKEVSYIPSEGYPAGELKHGTLALIDNATVSVFIATDKNLTDKYKNSVEQVISRGGIAAIITDIDELETGFKGRAHIIKLPCCRGHLSPLVTATAVQLLAYETAVSLGLNPDKPRNLAKSVTVE